MNSQMHGLIFYFTVYLEKYEMRGVPGVKIRSALIAGMQGVGVSCCDRGALSY